MIDLLYRASANAKRAARVAESKHDRHSRRTSITAGAEAKAEAVARQNADRCHSYAEATVDTGTEDVPGCNVCYTQTHLATRQFGVNPSRRIVRTLV
jgi:hypothetical protein